MHATCTSPFMRVGYTSPVLRSRRRAAITVCKELQPKTSAWSFFVWHSHRMDCTAKVYVKDLNKGLTFSWLLSSIAQYSESVAAGLLILTCKLALLWLNIFTGFCNRGLSKICGTDFVSVHGMVFRHLNCHCTQKLKSWFPAFLMVYRKRVDSSCNASDFGLRGAKSESRGWKFMSLLMVFVVYSVFPDNFENDVSN